MGTRLPKADVILTNPPFGTKRVGRPTRNDLPYVTSNKQLAFLQHVYCGLKPGGRAAMVLSDNVLFEEGMGAKLRADLMDKCNLHTILRLPTGIFYAQGVKTNVLFFTRCPTDTGNTQTVWVYDLRTNMPAFGKRTPLTHDHFAEFEACYGSKSDGTGERIDQGDEGHFRCFTRQEIAKRGDNLDISWLKSDGIHSADDLPEPDEIATLIRERLQTAMEEIDTLSALLEGEEVGA
jgi:type I restriction enzyme M protein